MTDTTDPLPISVLHALLRGEAISPQHASKLLDKIDEYARQDLGHAFAPEVRRLLFKYLTRHVVKP